MINGKRIFVSGGAGVIGMEMIPKLIARGAIVMVADLKRKPISFNKSIIYHQGDLNEMTKRELEQFAPDIIIHLAATFERSDESYGFWDENYRHNFQLSHHLMSIAKDLASLKRVVFASSYLIYEPGLYQFPTPQKKATSLRESDPVRPRNLTGMAKFAHEIELRFLDQHRHQNFSIVCARIYRGYGKNSRDIISRWIRSLLDSKPITIYRPEGMFDYIYASDSAEGLIRLSESEEIKGVINLGTGRARSVGEVVSVLRNYFPDMQAIESEIDIPYEASQADMTKFHEKLKWTPKHDLEQSIPEIIDYERLQRTLHNQSSPYPTPVVLISSASRKVPLLEAIRKAALRIDPKARVIAGDIALSPITSYVADDFWAMPPTSDESINSILQGCKTRGINIVIPTRDGELLFWAKHTELLEKNGIRVIISSATSLLKCIDKLKFSEFGIEKNLSIIPSATDLNLINTNRLVVKERFGAGSRSIGINLDRVRALEHAQKLQEPIYQPFIEGVEFSVDSWVDNKHIVKGLILRRRDIVVDGESQVTTTFSDDVIEAKVKVVIEALELSGPVVLQAIIDKNKNLHVIECNARFGGASTTGIKAGLDSFYWSILESQGIDTEPYHFIRSSSQIRQIRVPSDIYIHDPSI